MRRELQILAAISLLISVIIFSACSHKDVPVPESSASATITAARTWYEQLTPPNAKSVAIAWQRARTLNSWVVAPLADTTNLFADVHKAAYRYLVVQTTGGKATTGRIVELVVEAASVPVEQVAQTVVLATQQLIAQQPPTQLLGLTGWVMLYSPTYHYQTGLIYEQGKVQPKQVRIVLKKATKASGPQPTDSHMRTNSLDNEIDCYYTIVCGYINGELSNCVPVIHCTGSIGGDGDGGGGDWGGGGGGGSGPTNTQSIDKSQLAPCQDNVLTNLQATTGAGLYSILKLFAGNTPGYNWTVKNGALPTGTYGSTSPYDRSTGSVTTTFDSNHWRDATDLSIARTMLHEEIHAYLVSYFANDPIYANATFSQFVDAWKVAPVGADPNIYHHNEMAQGWVGDVAWALKQYGISRGYNLSDQFYSDMAWAGLEDTALFKAKSPAEQTRIHNTIQTEVNGTDSNGNPTSQSGRKAGC